MADPTTSGINSYDVFKAKMGLLFNIQQESWIKDLYDVAKEQVDSGVSYQNDPLFYDLILQSPKAPQKFKDRFKIITDLKARKDAGEDIKHIPTIAEYVATEDAYNQIFTEYGMTDLANAENYAKLMSNNVNPNTLNQRLNIAYDVVKSSDQALKAQFGSLTDADLAKALVLGPEGLKDLQRKVDIANIKAEMTTRNIQTYTTAEQLQSAGFTRADVKQGLTALQEQLPSAQRLESLYGTTPPADIQQSLEQEIFQGIPYERRKKLAEREQAAFGGTTGIQRSSLSRRTSGMI